MLLDSFLQMRFRPWKRSLSADIIDQITQHSKERRGHDKEDLLRPGHVQNYRKFGRLRDLKATIRERFLKYSEIF